MLALSIPARAGILKACPVPPSGFLVHRASMTTDSDRSPFNAVWRNPSPRAWNRIENFDRLVIMPVNTNYIHPRTPCQQAQVDKMAAYTQAEFQKEFAQSGKYRVMLRPGPRTLILELALVQMKPTNVAGNVVCTGAGVVAPGANILGSMFTHGNIAFEAKLRNGETGELLAEYADSQNDKLSLFSFRDFSANAHNRKAINDWAKQMVELSTTPRCHKVAGAMRLTLNPF